MDTQGVALNPASGSGERVAAIDAARGWSLLGVAVVNAHTFNVGFNGGNYAWDLALTGYDRTAELVSNLIFAHRSLPVLAFLLGVGLVVQTRTLERAQVSGALYGRYMALMVLGVLHGLLLWPGEILASYAIIVLVLARYAVRWGDVALQRVMVLLFIAAFATTVYWVFFDQRPLRCARSDYLATASFAQADWLTARWRGAIEFLATGLLGQVLLAWIWVLILLGVWCARREAFWQHLQNPSFRHPVVVTAMVILALSSAAEWLLGRAGGWSSLACEGAAISRFYLAETTTVFAAVPVLMTIFAAVAKRFRTAAGFSLLVAVGRSPLTMFIGQSVVFTLLFSQTFLGLHGTLGRAAVLLIALLTYGLLAVWIDRRYVQHHRMPPGERLWRALARRLGRA